MNWVHLKNASSQRYPRWGLLDRYAVSPYLARAIATAIVMQAIGLGGYSLWQKNQPTDVPTLIFHHGTRAIDLGRWTLDKTKSLQPSPQRIAIHRQGRVIPVPNPIVLVEATDPFPDPAQDGDGRTGIGPPTPGPSNGGPPGDIIQVDIPLPNKFIRVEQPPELIEMPAPRYPSLAREAGIEGNVLIRVLVNPHGFVEQAIVVKSVPMLDEPAVEAAQQAVFKPGVQAGQPIYVWVMIPIEFTLWN